VVAENFAYGLEDDAVHVLRDTKRWLKNRGLEVFVL
jgi:hypothetical protein